MTGKRTIIGRFISGLTRKREDFNILILRSGELNCKENKYWSLPMYYKKTKSGFHTWTNRRFDFIPNRRFKIVLASSWNTSFNTKEESKLKAADWFLGQRHEHLRRMHEIVIGDLKTKK